MRFARGVPRRVCVRSFQAQTGRVTQVVEVAQGRGSVAVTGGVTLAVIHLNASGI